MPKVNLIGEVYHFNNGIIGRVIDIYDDYVKLRCISSCKGRCSKKSRIGKPYTYQRWSKINCLEKAHRVGTEELLLTLFIGKDKYWNKIIKDHFELK